MCSQRLLRAAPRSTNPAAPPSRGLSIVELMFGLVVALLVSLAVVNNALSFWASQRQSIGATGAAVNSVAVLTTPKDDVSVAGLGFFGDATYLCRTLDFSVAAKVVVNGAAFSPLQVQRTANGDIIDVVFGTRVEASADVRLREASNGSSSALESSLPVSVGGAVLLAPATPDPAQPCLMRSVTQVTDAAGGASQLLALASTGRHNGAAFTTAPAFNDNGRFTQLGTVHWVRYRVVGGNLLGERQLEGTSAVMARNIVSFRMQYGVSANTPSSTALEAWVAPVWPNAKDPFDSLPLWPTPVANTPSMVDDLWHATIDGRGQMYLTTTPVETAAKIRAGLDDILDEQGSESGVGVSTVNLMPVGGYAYLAS